MYFLVCDEHCSAEKQAFGTHNNNELSTSSLLLRTTLNGATGSTVVSDANVIMIQP